MKCNKLFKLSRFLIPVLITSLLASCSASQHLGVKTINEPPLTDENESTWLLYYENQFDVNEGNVMAPSIQYPQCAIQAFERAKTNWTDKVNAAREEAVVSYVTWGLVVIIIIAIPLLALSAYGSAVR